MKMFLNFFRHNKTIPINSDTHKSENSYDFFHTWKTLSSNLFKRKKIWNISHFLLTFSIYMHVVLPKLSFNKHKNIYVVKKLDTVEDVVQLQSKSDRIFVVILTRISFFLKLRNSDFFNLIRNKNKKEHKTLMEFRLRSGTSLFKIETW